MVFIEMGFRMLGGSQSSSSLFDFFFSSLVIVFMEMGFRMLGGSQSSSSSVSPAGTTSVGGSATVHDDDMTATACVSFDGIFLRSSFLAFLPPHEMDLSECMHNNLNISDYM